MDMMNKLTRIATPLIAVAMMTGASMTMLAQSGTQAMQPEANAAQNWDTPPAGPAEARQGFLDGIQAAKIDKAANRPVDPKVSYLYVHPPVKKGAARDAYLASFETGYKAAVQHGAAS